MTKQDTYISVWFDSTSDEHGWIVDRCDEDDNSATMKCYLLESDVEGVAIDGRKAKIVARYTLDQFAAKVCPEVAGLTADEIDYTVAYEACPLWYAATRRI